jgi:hypothetical protein
MVDNLKRSLYAIRAGSAFEKSLLKATYDGDFDPPKEKHVQTVLWSLQGKSDKHSPDQSLNLTVQRLNTGKWVTILKCLMILHRGIELVGSNFPQKVASLNLLLGSFNDPTEKGSAHNKIIQDYYSYIKLKALAFSKKESLMNIEDSEKGRTVTKMRSFEVIKELGLLTNTLEGLVKLGPSCHQALKNYHLRLTQNCVFLILKDSASLFKACSLLVDKSIEVFNTLDRSHAEVVAELYQKFETCSRMLEQFFKMSEILPYSGLTVPVFVNRPRDVVNSMKDYIRDQPKSQSRGLSSAADKEDESLGIDMSAEELEAQRVLLEQFEKEHKKKVDDERHNSLIFDPIPSQAKSPKAEPSKVDLILDSFSNPQAAHPNPGAPGAPGMMAPGMMAPGMMAPGMMNPGMMNPGMMNPGMMNPGMMNPGMMNPMMMNPMMMNPMMTGMMMNPFMTGMSPMMGVNPMMAGMGTAPIKSNLDPTTQASGSAIPDNKKNPFAAKPSQQGGGGQFIPAGGNNLDNLFGSKPAPTANSRANNPFESGDKKPANSGAKDPFSDLI